MTNDQVGWVIELSVHKGQLRSWKKLMREMVASMRAEPGTLTYEWMLGEDGTTCQLFERYTGAAAAVRHSHNFEANFATRFFELADPVRLMVYGEPGAELRATFASLSPTYLTPIGGFDRSNG